MSRGITSALDRILIIYFIKLKKITIIFSGYIYIFCNFWEYNVKNEKNNAIGGNLFEIIKEVKVWV